jgi:hypothetical protein
MVYIKPMSAFCRKHGSKRVEMIPTRREKAADGTYGLPTGYFCPECDKLEKAKKSGLKYPRPVNPR